MSQQVDTLTLPAYPAARTIAPTLERYFASHLGEARERNLQKLATEPDAAAIEAIIDAAFWASLRREEGYSPKISLAFLGPEQAGQPLTFEKKFPLSPAVLSRLAPAVERPGIHLGVWRASDNSADLRVWGTTRSIPKLCFVLEVIEPGLLVVKYRRGHEPGKYVNVAVLKGDQIKMVDDSGPGLPDCPELITSMLDFGSQTLKSDSVNVLVQLSVSMRAHGRGGSLLVVPKGSDKWRRSILQPVSYLVRPPFSELADLMRRDPIEKSQQIWQEAFIDAVDAIAGLTAVDGAALISDQFELLAFGAKIGRRDDGALVEQVIVTEPILDGVGKVVHPLELGGTRHLSAAQFVQDQPDCVALVASVDGHFTVFAWSPCEGMVHAHRVEALLM
jgi:hypothetical protein